MTISKFCVIILYEFTRKVGDRVANISKAGEWLEPEKLTLLTAWARDGLVDEQIAKNIRKYPYKQRKIWWYSFDLDNFGRQ